MALIRALVCGAALVIALSPLTALAADGSSDHIQAELANGQAQWDLTTGQVSDIQQQANLSAANERMIAVLHSESLRQRQLNQVANATAMEQIAATLANNARSDGLANAQNELQIAQIQAAGLIAGTDANIANALAIGRYDEVQNARAQSQFLHQTADLISGLQAEQKMTSARQVGQARADAIHTPALAQQVNADAMGANDLLAADTALAAGQLNATSVTIGASVKAAALVDHAASSLHSDKVRAGVN